jgi:hypothetical protein
MSVPSSLEHKSRVKPLSHPVRNWLRTPGPARPRYSITSSARASSVGGMSRPSAFAVLRLTINSTFVDCFYAASFSFSRHLPKLSEMMRTDATAVVLSDLRRAISCLIRSASADK